LIKGSVSLMKEKKHLKLKRSKKRKKNREIKK